MSKTLRTKKALTLTEMIIYLALYGTFFITAIGFFVSVSSYNREAEDRLHTDKGAILLSEHLKDTFRITTSVDAANSVLSNDLGKIRLTGPGGYFEYRIENSRLIFDNNGSATNFITPPDVGVSKFRFEPIIDKVGTTTVGLRSSIILYNIEQGDTVLNFETSYIF